MSIKKSEQIESRMNKINEQENQEVKNIQFLPNEEMNTVCSNNNINNNDNK